MTNNISMKLSSENFFENLKNHITKMGKKNHESVSLPIDDAYTYYIF